MGNFIDELDKKTLDAGKKFITDIEDGLYFKRTLQNTSEDYPLQKAAESFKHFITTKESKDISKID